MPTSEQLNLNPGETFKNFDVWKAIYSRPTVFSKSAANNLCLYMRYLSNASLRHYRMSAKHMPRKNTLKIY